MFTFKLILIATLCLTLSFFIIYGISYWKVTKLDHKMEEEKAEGNTTLFRELKALSILTAFVIELGNKIMGGWIGGLNRVGRHDTHSDSVIAQAKGMLWCKVINSALVPLIVNLVGFREIEEGHYRKVYNNGMMVEDVCLVMMILAFAEPLWYLISPGFLCEKRKRCCIRKSRDGKRLLDFDQEEANELYEKEEVELAE